MEPGVGDADAVGLVEDNELALEVAEPDSVLPVGPVLVVDAVAAAIDDKVAVEEPEEALSKPVLAPVVDVVAVTLAEIEADRDCALVDDAEASPVPVALADPSPEAVRALVPNADPDGTAVELPAVDSEADCEGEPVAAVDSEPEPDAELELVSVLPAVRLRRAVAEALLDPVEAGFRDGDPDGVEAPESDMDAVPAALQESVAVDDGGAEPDAVPAAVPEVAAVAEAVGERPAEGVGTDEALGGAELAPEPD